MHRWSFLPPRGTRAFFSTLVGDFSTSSLSEDRDNSAEREEDEGGDEEEAEEEVDPPTESITDANDIAAVSNCICDRVRSWESREREDTYT